MSRCGLGGLGCVVGLFIYLFIGLLVPMDFTRSICKNNCSFSACTDVDLKTVGCIISHLVLQGFPSIFKHNC